MWSQAWSPVCWVRGPCAKAWRLTSQDPAVRSSRTVCLFLAQCLVRCLMVEALICMGTWWEPRGATNYGPQVQARNKTVLFWVTEIWTRLEPPCKQLIMGEGGSPIWHYLRQRVLWLWPSQVNLKNGNNFIGNHVDAMGHWYCLKEFLFIRLFLTKISSNENLFVYYIPAGRWYTNMKCLPDCQLYFFIIKLIPWHPKLFIRSL